MLVKLYSGADGVKDKRNISELLSMRSGVSWQNDLMVMWLWSQTALV